MFYVQSTNQIAATITKSTFVLVDCISAKNMTVKIEDSCIFRGF